MLESPDYLTRLKDEFALAALSAMMHNGLMAKLVSQIAIVHSEAVNSGKPVPDNRARRIQAATQILGKICYETAEAALAAREFHTAGLSEDGTGEEDQT